MTRDIAQTRREQTGFELCNNDDDKKFIIIMALFEVPGWTVPKLAQPSPSSSSNARKRKRPSGVSDDKLQSAEVNLEKLMKKIGHEGEAAKGKGRRTGEGKGKEKEKARDGNYAGVKHAQNRSTHDVQKSSMVAPHPPHHTEKGNKSKKGRRDADGSKSRFSFNKAQSEDLPERDRGRSPSSSSPAKSTDATKKRKRDKGEKSKTEGDSVLPQSFSASNDEPRNLTSMQVKMKQSLDGARFR